MCIVSMIGDDYSRRGRWPTWPEAIPFPVPGPKGKDSIVPDMSKYVTRAEFDALKAQVEQMKRELESARKQDIEEGNEECEMEEKVYTLKEIAKMFGIDLTGVFPNG